MTTESTHVLLIEDNPGDADLIRLRLVEAHVMAAERLHADDTTVPVLAKGKTDTGRCWIYVRDDRPFGGGPVGSDVLLLPRPQG